MKVAFWNVNMGPSSTIKLEVFYNWLRGMRPGPDLLVLEELSEDIISRSPRFKSAIEEAGLVSIRSVAQSRRNFSGLAAAKSIFVFYNRRLRRRGYSFKAGGSRVTLASSRYEAVRRMLKVNISYRGGLRHVVFGVHANASYVARFIFERVLRLMYSRGFREKPVSVGGDFNLPIDEAEALVIAKSAPVTIVDPINFDQQPLPFTQWSRAGYSRERQREAFRELGIDDLSYVGPTIDPHNVIDYLVVGERSRSRALPNCRDPEELLSILRTFDHFPVVYELTL